MSEETEVAEVEQNPILDLVQATLDKNYTVADDIFKDQLGQKMQDALEQEKIKIASRIYNMSTDEEEEELDLEIDDEDLEVDEDEEDNEEEEEEVVAGADAAG